MRSVSERHYFIGIALAGVLLFAAGALWLRGGGSDGGGRTREDVVAPASEVCSQTETSVAHGLSEEAVRDARADCEPLSRDARARCEAGVGELAAREAVHLARGECDRMTTEAARSACRSVVAAQATPASTPPPATRVPETTRTPEPTRTPEVVATPEATQTVPATVTPAPQPPAATPAEQPTLARTATANFGGNWTIVDTVTEGAGVGSAYSFDVALVQSGSALQGGNFQLFVVGRVDGNTATLQFNQPGPGFTGLFVWTMDGTGNASGSFTTSVPNGGTSQLIRR